VRFDAEADQLTITATLATACANLSCCCWVKRRVDKNAFSTALYLIGSTTPLEIFLETETGGDVMHAFELPATESDITGPTLTLDTWFFIGYIRTNTSRSLFYGTEAGGTLTKTTNSDTRTVTGALTGASIGQDPFTEGFNGDIVWVRLWDAVISDADMDAEWRSATLVRTANRRAEWRLTSAATATTDSSGNGFTLTVGGTLADGTTNPTPPAVSTVPPGLGPDLGMQMADHAAGALARF
jgi:Concanavalin A-like lectin/glucanases superfamily